MSTTELLEKTLEMALALPLHERLRLVEQVVASVGDEIAAQPTLAEPEKHWGKSLNALIDRLDLSEWEAMEIDDPMTWVKAVREQDETRYDGYWAGTK
jgi:hypothetical protein